MSDVLPLLLDGLGIALLPENLFYALLGAFVGTMVGVLPGIGPTGAMALLLPVVTTMEPVSALIMLASLYSGAMYGGSTTSILLNVPGESSSVVTCLDGHQMALQGRAGSALSIAAIGSYIAGTLGVVGLMLFAPLIASSALAFGPPEYFALMVFGLSAVASLSGASLVKGLLSMCIGLMLTTVGTDVTGVARFTFGSSELRAGVEFLAVSIGVFAISEVLLNARSAWEGVPRTIIKHRVYIRFAEIRESFSAILRGSFIGFFVGVLPGAGASIASFLSYSVEMQISRDPEKFGRGEIRGVAAPESANNASSVGALVPMLTLGIPGSGTTAILLIALASLDVHAGPLLFVQRPDIIWGLVAALYVGNVMLLILNLPMVGLFVRLLYTPMYVLLPAILMISVVGVYSVSQSYFDLYALVALGLLGFFLRKNGFPMAPVILGFVLGGRMEEAIRQSMILTRGEILPLVERPITASFLCLAVFAFAVPILLRQWRIRGRRIAMEGEEA